MQRPLIVYVSGAPGSGKTTLARLLADRLYVPVISSDLIHGGVALSNPKHNREQTLLNIFVPLLIEMSKNGVSCVVDQVLRRGESETSIIDRLRPYAVIVNIHAMCADPIERYKMRVESGDSSSITERRNILLERAEQHKDSLQKTHKPLSLDLPLLTVNTDDSYTPSLDAIVSFIMKSYRT